MSFPSYMQPPRLCQLKKWSTYAGYGFNLHAEKGKAGQYIGKVDPDSPAELGGLKTKDYLIEVNGTNVENLTHQMVVEKVKESSDIVRMLVVEMDVYKHCKEHGIVISSDMPEVVVYFTPETQPTAMSIDTHQEVRKETVQQQHQKPPHQDQRHSDAADHAVSSSSIKEVDEEIEEEEVPDSEFEPTVYQQPQSQQSQPPQQQQQRETVSAQPYSGSNRNGSGSGSNSKSSNNNNIAGNDPVANVSLEEMRARIGNNRRTQVKMNPSSFSEKYNMFQAL